MSCVNNFGDINETFIIEPLVLDDTFVTGFTLSSNNIILTQNRIDQYSAFTITLSGLTGSSLNVYVTGGTYNNTTGTATFVNSTGGTFQVTGFTTGSTSTASGNYLPLSGGTVTGNTIFQSGLTANTISATTISGDTFYGDGSKLTGIIASAQFTGGTVNGPTNFISGLTANTISATTYQNLPKDVFVTGGTYSAAASTLIFKNNTGGTFNVSGITTSTQFTGGTVSGATVFISGLTANTISATTYLNLPVTADTFVTGFTLSSNTITLTQNRIDQYSAFTISLSAYTGTSSASGAYLPLSGGTVSGNTVFTSGLTITAASPTESVLDLRMKDDGLWGFRIYNDTYSSSLIGLAGWVDNTGISYLGTETDKPLYIYNNGVSKNYQPTVVISSSGVIIYTALTANSLTIINDTLLSGLTATTISATTYQNLPKDVFVTGGTYSAAASTLIFTNNSGGTFNVSGITTSTQFTGGTVSGATVFISGLTANTISATTYLNLPTDIRTTGATYSDNRFTFNSNSGGTATTFSVLFNTVTGLTANSLTVTGSTFLSGLTASTISASTYFNLPTYISATTLSGNVLSVTANNGTAVTYTLSAVTGGSYSNGTLTLSGSGGVNGIQITGFTTGSSTTFTGGTVSGATNFISGLTANTISATTYQNLPKDVFVTGGTYSGSNITFTNNTGGTFNVSGITTSATFTGGTVSGPTIFTSGLTANTISATTYLNLPVTADTFVTGFTLSSNTITLTQNRLGQYSAFTISLSAYTGSSVASGAYLPLSGGTVSGATSFISGLTANTISATTYQNLPNTLYTGDGVLSGNRIVNLSGKTLNFSSSTSANNLVLSGGSVGIGTATPSASALFEISSTIKGFLGPRMTEAQRLAITATAGLIVYQTDADEGYFLYKSFGWIQIM